MGRTRGGDADALFAEVVEEVVRLGFPREFGFVVASELGGEWSLSRMLGYLRGVRPTSLDEIADELVSILDDRARIVRQMEAERSNAAITAFYNRPDSVE